MGITPPQPAPVPQDYVGVDVLNVSVSNGQFTNVANKACIYELPRVRQARTLTTAWLRVSSAAGNVCIALVDPATGTRLATTGSFACPAAGLRSRALTSALDVYRGQRLAVAVSADVTTAQVYALPGLVGDFMAPSGAPLYGGDMDTAFPIPSTVTPTGVPSRLPVIVFT